VVSDFDPLGDEAKLEIFYTALKQSEVYTSHFINFVKYEKKELDIAAILTIENGFADFIKTKKKEAKDLKTAINKYFKILNLIEFVIELEEKFSEANFLEFWRRFNNEYNNINKQDEIIDDVEIYFDNKIGIIAPAEYKDKVKSKPPVNGGTNGTGDRQYKFDILKVIAKRNQEEEAIEELIKDFEIKIEKFFEYVKADEAGIRVIAKMQDDGSAFDEEEIYEDFAKIYRKFVRRNKDLGEFFIRETQDIIHQLCDDFERTLIREYPENDMLTMAAVPE
jgi:type I restriction enzyme R subunit